MPARDIELHPTIDRAWLEAVSRIEPLPHAYALWDLLRLPRSVRFVSATERGRTIAYLLVWLGFPRKPVVHWVGETRGTEALAEHLPPPPFAALVPAGAERTVRARFPRAVSSPTLLLWRDRGPTGIEDPERLVRRLGPSDRSTLTTWVERGGDRDRPQFGPLDLSEEPVWGAFAQGRLVGVVRAAIRLPGVWVVAGVHVDPEFRGHGLSRRLLGALIEEAERFGSPTGLFVREDAAPARHVYASLGYREVGRRLWMDVPAEEARRSGGLREGGEPL